MSKIFWILILSENAKTQQYVLRLLIVTQLETDFFLTKNAANFLPLEAKQDLAFQILLQKNPKLYSNIAHAWYGTDSKEAF